MAEAKPLDQKDMIINALADYVAASERLWDFPPGISVAKVREDMLTAKQRAIYAGFLWPEK